MTTIRFEYLSDGIKGIIKHFPFFVKTIPFRDMRGFMTNITELETRFGYDGFHMISGEECTLNIDRNWAWMHIGDDSHLTIFAFKTDIMIVEAKLMGLLG